MEEMGLAQQSVNAGPQGPDMAQVMQEVVRLLQQGVEPQELLDMGVPQEVIQQALMMLEQSGKQQVPSDGGLATSVPR